ncbi:MAG: anthranilate synthase component I family protein [Paenibacillus sp.]|nr:anthranilate synthase component I family protein [Paenibacillus sp.]
MSQHRLNIISRIIPADLETPVGIYLKIRDLYPESALLESSDYHTSQNSVSLIGVCPIGSFSVNNDSIELSYPDSPASSIAIKDGINVVKVLKEYMASYAIEGADAGTPSGFLGYTAYDAVRYFENVNIQKKEECFASIPDMKYNLYRFIIKVNHYKNQMTIYEHLVPGQTSGIEEIISVIHNNNVALYPFSVTSAPESSVTDEEFKDMVRRGIKHSMRGDVFQIVPSRRFSQHFEGDEFNVYRALRCINPSPYLFYFDFSDFRIFGSSPETHLKVNGSYAYIDPIAGTFKRTGDDLRDHELAKALLEDDKENAEHIMLVDLARNDLSRSGGKVSIEFLKQIQYYSHVIHMVSRVKAELPKDADVLRLFADTFPAGTLSGAPKVRAMQLINEIEPHSRMTYGGCIGFIGFNGDLNQAITIRSFLSHDNKLYFQAGAGIVAHSNPENELQETNNKLGALVKALNYAESFGK